MQSAIQVAVQHGIEDALNQKIGDMAERMIREDEHIMELLNKIVRERVDRACRELKEGADHAARP